MSHVVADGTLSMLRVDDVAVPPSVRQPVPGFASAIRDVVVVASSSRSGSSVFNEMLQASRALLHLPGEINTLLRLAGLSWPHSGSGSDRLGVEHAQPSSVQTLEDLLSLEAGEPTAASDTIDEDFASRLLWRLRVQWPGEQMCQGDVQDWAQGALDEVQGRHGSCDWSRDLELFHALFLRRVRARHASVNPYCYDLAPSLIATTFDNVTPPSGAPGPCVIEEPPFVLIRPWHRPPDWAQRPLVIKTPSNAYRLDFLKALFPRARLRILYLVRNPAASINGLFDGWRHWGFHSHYVGANLELGGYAEDRPGDRGWWKFDLPPGWDAYSSHALERVCAFQWCAAHESILEFLRTSGVDVLQVKFESIVGDAETRSRTMGEVHRWCGGAAGSWPSSEAAVPSRPVMAVTAPGPSRWRRRRQLLAPVLDDARVRVLAAALGYEDDTRWV